MAEVYKLNVRLKGFDDLIWRDIEVTDVTNVAKIGYAVIAAFEGKGSHIFHEK